MIFGIFKKRQLKKQELKGKLSIIRGSLERERERLDKHYKYESTRDLIYHVNDVYCYIIDVLKDIEEEI